MAKVRLDDFKVRVLGSSVGSDAMVRVWTTFGDDKEQWNVAGVSSNIIEASWLALIDGLCYKILKDQKKFALLLKKASMVSEDKSVSKQAEKKVSRRAMMREAKDLSRPLRRRKKSKK